jgi:hypothetical protein
MFLTVKNGDRWREIQGNAHSIPGFEWVDISTFKLFGCRMEIT